MKKRFIALIVVGSIVVAGGLTWGGIAIANANVNNALRKYIESFDPVDYNEETRLKPSKDAEGRYYFTTDGDFKIMHLTDIHIAGGISSKDRDMKTIYELITMLQAEKPDLAILSGDNVYPVPGPAFGGGTCFDNKNVARTLIDIFEHEHVYFTTVFGNHDTEAFDYYKRETIGKLYQSNEYKYSLFQSEFSDKDAKRPSVTNQVIQVKDTSGHVRKNLLMMDTNDYETGSIFDSINWKYDVIHDAQVDWAKQTLTTLNTANGSDPKTLAFIHIPVSEYEIAYRELEASNWASTPTSTYIEGVWDEEVNEKLGGRIWYGGCMDKSKELADKDKFFEELGPDGMNTLEGVFCGHDHVNNAVVNYKGVMLSYGYSLDNTAYTDIKYSGKQRGATVINLASDGTWTQTHKNAYTDYGVSTNKFVDIYLDKYMYENCAPSL